eukprot:Gb_35558 [translate_table: standard]
MVVPLGPGKFYGSGLPRPWIYNDVKFNSERVDPPPSVSAPLLSWASGAHWSMGGLCSTRKRMQGKIEGSLKKLRAQEEEEEEVEDTKAEENLVKVDSHSPQSSPANSAPANAQDDSQELDDEDCPTFVPEKRKKPARKQTSRVRVPASVAGGGSDESIAKPVISEGNQSSKVSRRRETLRKKGKEVCEADEIKRGSESRAAHGCLRRSSRLSLS